MLDLQSGIPGIPERICIDRQVNLEIDLAFALSRTDSPSVEEGICDLRPDVNCFSDRTKNFITCCTIDYCVRTEDLRLKHQ